MYKGADQSWRERPRYMSVAVARAAVEAIAVHVRAYALTGITIIFHGGEPLLAGAERIDKYCTEARATIPAEIAFGMQTNGTLLNEDMLEVLSRHNVNVGVSLDGNRLANDRHRLFRNGRSSHKQVLNGIELMRSRPEWARLMGGALCVLNLNNEPGDVYNYLISLGLRKFDILLPDHHHDFPPPRPVGTIGQIAYGLWLSKLFDLWLSGDHDVQIRFFEELISLIVGGESLLEAIGAKPVDLVVIEADGEIESVDTLKIVGRPATNLGLNVASNSFDEALQHPAIYSRMLGHEALCKTCRACPELKNCGGGYLPHRYSRMNGFQNPSVYCSDLQFLIGHIKRRLSSELSEHTRKDLQCSGNRLRP
jgi:uncharacterized protein